VTNQAHIVAPRKKRRSATYWAGRLLLYAVLLLGVYIIMLPLSWMVMTSLKDKGEVFNTARFFPKTVMWENYTDIFTIMPFGRYITNTLIIAAISMIGHVFVSAVVAFGFARLRFPGRNVLFVVMLSTMMLPYAVTMIPQYFIFGKLGWHDSYYPLTIPHLFGNAFYIFLYRQFFMSIPRQMDEAAKIDGCGTLRIFLQITLPLSLPVLGTISIFSFNGTWNDFLGPMLYINSEYNRTVQLGVNAMRGLYMTQWHYLMAASMIALAPVVLLFFLFQRTMIQGIVVTGVKG